VSTVAVDLAFRLSGREVFTTAEAPSAANEENRTLRVGNHNVNKALGATTTPAVTGPPISRAITLTSAVITQIDLTAAAVLSLPAAATRTYDFTAKKVVAFLIRTAAANNAAGVNIAPGAANPYPLFGTANDITLLPDSEIQFGFLATASALPAVSGTVKNIDITGTTGDIVYIDMYLGA
jgi:hypothetical protein